MFYYRDRESDVYDEIESTPSLEDSSVICLRLQQALQQKSRNYHHYTEDDVSMIHLCGVDVGENLKSFHDRGDIPARSFSRTQISSSSLFS